MTRADDSPVADYASLLRLDGRRFVLVGAGQGMGRQTAHALAQLGARVVCVDVDVDRADDIAAEIDGDAIAFAGDVTERAVVRRLFAEAEQAMGGVDGVVDIVGMAQYGDLVDMDDEQWDWHFDLCLRQAWMVMQEGGKALTRAGGGSMAFVASASGLTGAPRHSAYGAAKAGLMALVRSGAVELGPHSIRINAVAPGVVWTPRVSAYLGQEGHDLNAENTPLQRVAQTSNVASALLFLVSDLADYVNGQTLVVDGGVSAKFPYPMDGL